MSNTFFISPLIPLKYYLIIKKEQNNSNLNWTQEEIIVLNKINALFNYESKLSDYAKRIIYNIIKKISENIPKYDNILDKLTFVNQDTYKEITNYNFIYYNLLKQRNYQQIINPLQVDNINITVGLSDTGPLVDKDVSTFKQLQTDEEKMAYILNIIEEKNDSFDNTTKIVHDIMARSSIDAKINTITKILSNKSVLYHTLAGEDFIPISESFDVSEDDNVLDTLINKFKQSIQSDYFVIKPAEGTLSDGVGIFNKEQLDLNFVRTWTQNPENNKYSYQTATGRYNSWILSEFIQSFLWKLQGQNVTSQVFPALTTKEPNLRINFNDQIGRINKFRFWALYTIIDGEFTSYLYKDGYCEIALEELTNYSKTQLDPANIESFYQELLDTEEDSDTLQKVVERGVESEDEEKVEAAFIGTYLDFAYVVNENNFPLGADTWNNTLMPNMYILVNTLAEKMKRFMTCMNKYTIGKNNPARANRKHSKGCYSFFALDIIIDANGKPWLLETNSRPFVGFGDYFSKYDPNREHVLNVNDVFNSVLGLTTDVVNGGSLPSVKYDNFLVTHVDTIANRNKIYIPYSLGITPTATSNVYNEIYSVLDHYNYVAFPYPREMSKRRVSKAIGFRGMSPISKFLISKIKELGNDKFISLMQDLFPYDAKMKVLNRINTLAFYLGDKAEMTRILKENLQDWDSIIPYSDTINISQMTDQEIQQKIQTSPLSTGTIIAKPAYGQQGKGIIISNNSGTLISEMHKNTEDKDFVLSKYLDNPYLIKLRKMGVSNVNYDDQYGRKCHMRAYVLVHKQNKKLKVYLYRESLIFCAAKEYNSCDKDSSSYCNLTNLFFGSKYYKEVLGKNPGDAYKNLSGLARHLIPREHYNQLMERVKYIITRTIRAVKDDLLCINDNNNCYQYIAFDLHLENSQNSQNLQTQQSIAGLNEVNQVPVPNPVPVPWLLEVNATPGLKSPSYQWQNIGGLQNFLESILNITVGTKISRGHKQLFEYLPYRQKVNGFGMKEISFKY
jgi:hypothetical protein